MATRSPSAALVPASPIFSNAERLALAGFLAGYSGLTRQAYELDLRQYASWCQQHHVHLLVPMDARLPIPGGCTASWPGGVLAGGGGATGVAASLAGGRACWGRQLMVAPDTLVVLLPGRRV